MTHAGQFEEGLQRGSFADPNGPGLEGLTALMEAGPMRL